MYVDINMVIGIDCLQALFYEDIILWGRILEP